MTPGPIFLLTGPPGAGKTTVSALLLSRFQKGLHIPVDELRTWVVSGLSESVDWTDETERQFQIAERAACKVAQTYSEAGFAVVIDHCRNIPRLNQVVKDELEGSVVHKVLLLPSLQAALERNRTRTNKDFDTEVLEDIIRGTHQMYSEADRTGWVVIDSTDLSPAATLASIPSP